MYQTKIEIHHIIPASVYRDHLDALRGVFDEVDFIQDYGNRIALFKEQSFVDHFNKIRQTNPGVWRDLPVGSVYHSSDHKGYNLAISEKLDKIFTSDLSNDQKKFAVIDLQQVLRNELKNPDFNLYAPNFEIAQLIESKTISFTEIKSAIGERYEQSLRYLDDFEKQKDYFEKNDSFKEAVKKGQSSAPNTIYRADFYKNIAKTILDNKDKILIDDLMTPEVKQQYLEVVQRLYNGEYGAWSVSKIGDSVLYYAGVFSGVEKENLQKFQIFLNQANEDEKLIIQNKIAEKQALLNDVSQIKTEVRSEINKLQKELLKSDVATLDFIHTQLDVLNKESTALANQEAELRGDINKAANEHKINEKIGMSLKGQAGYINVAVIHEGLKEVFDTIRASAKEGSSNTFEMSGDKLVLADQGKMKYASFIDQQLIGGKFGVATIASEFFAATIDSAIKGVDTGDWGDFQQNSAQFGVVAVQATLGFAIVSHVALLAPGALSYAAVNLLGGLGLYGAYTAGYALGTAMYKLNKHASDKGLYSFSDLYTDEDFDRWADFLTPDFIKNFLNINRDGISYFYDPLVLDLNKDGIISTVAHNRDAGALFDNDADGLRVATGWVDPVDGLLVLDRNGDGVIGDGTEVFGDNTPLSDGGKSIHGFAALADLDDNQDGVIDANDGQFNELRVWRDFNQDGIGQQTELSSLTELGIKTLNLDYQDVDIALGGDNRLAQLGSFESTNGEIHVMGDVNFSFNSIYSEFDESIEIREDLLTLPNLKGYGGVRDLQEAMMESEELEVAVRAFLSATTFDTQDEQLVNVLKYWAETNVNFKSYDHGLNKIEIMSGVETHTEFHNSEFDAIKWKIGIIDSFYGLNGYAMYFMNEAEVPGIIDHINKNFEAISNQIHKALFMDSVIAGELYGSVTHEWGVNDQSDLMGLNLNFNSSLGFIEEKYSETPNDAFKALVLLIQYMDIHTDLVLESGLSQIKARLFDYFEDVNPSLIEWVVSYSSLSIVAGDHNNDQLYVLKPPNAEQREDVFIGGSGDDYLMSEYGFSVFVGGSGDDELVGAQYKKDTYLFNHGHGNDLIIDRQYSDSSSMEDYDQVRFVGANLGDALFKRIDDNLVICAYGASDSVTLSNYFLMGANTRVFSFIFEDEIIDSRYLKNILIDYTTTHNNAFMESWFGLNRVFGTDGNDYINLMNESVLMSSKGDDVIVGSDFHSNNYIFESGHGADSLQDRDYGGARNIIKFVDLDFSSAVFTMSGSDLVISALGVSDSVRLIYFFESKPWQSYDFHFNGMLATDYDLSRLKINIPTTDGDDYYSVNWSIGSFVFEGGDGNDTFYGYNGNDYIDGGAGDDLIDLYAGNNTVIGGAGNDVILLGSGQDTLIYSLLTGFEGDALAGNGVDQVHNFNTDDDYLDLSGLLALEEPIGVYVGVAQEGNKVTLTLDRDGSGGVYQPTEFLTLYNSNISNYNDFLLNNVII